MTATPTTKLFCPKCGYDLTGSPADECPECGTTFNRTHLAELQAQQAQIGKRVWKRMLIPPGITFISSCIPLVSIYLAPLAGFVVFCVSIGLSIAVARDVALARRLTGQEGNLSPIAFKWLVGVGFFLGQVLLTAMAIFGGCAVAWGLLSMGNMNFH